MSILDYSTTASSNTSINGLSIAEGCAPSALNDMGREIMADIATDVSFQSITITAGSFNTFTLPSVPGSVLLLVEIANQSNSNLNASYLLLVNLRNTTVGGGNGVVTVSSAQQTTGTANEPAGISFAITGSGTSLSLRVNASTVGGTGTLVARARRVAL